MGVIINTLLLYFVIVLYNLSHAIIISVSQINFVWTYKYKTSSSLLQHILWTYNINYLWKIGDYDNSSMPQHSVRRKYTGERNYHSLRGLAQDFVTSSVKGLGNAFKNDHWLAF